MEIAGTIVTLIQVFGGVGIVMAMALGAYHAIRDFNFPKDD